MKIGRNIRDMRILVISWRMPSDNAPSAGRKTHNYYLKQLNNRPECDVSLFTFCEEKYQDFDLDKYDVANKIVWIKYDFVSRMRRLLFNMDSRFNPFNSSGHILPGWYKYQVKKNAQLIAKSGIWPDIIILEWTQMVLCISDLKAIFPNSKFIASEHDVSYLGLERMYLSEKKLLPKMLKKLSYSNLKRSELAAINQCDLVFTHNEKDREILLSDGVSEKNTDSIVAFYMTDVSGREYIWKKSNKDIVYYGDMGRPENYLSAIWFIENVMQKLSKISDLRFVIVGGNPPEQLLKYQSDRIVITGFVDDIYKFFSHSLCFVVPLLLGAGIKVKVLEAMAYGLVVLTNDLGIEGIPAVNGHDFIYCDSAIDYLESIKNISEGKVDGRKIGKNAKRLIQSEFDIQSSFVNYYDRLSGIVRM